MVLMVNVCIITVDVHHEDDCLQLFERSRNITFTLYQTKILP